MKEEAQKDNQELLDMIRELSKEVKLQLLIINNFIPSEHRKQLEDQAQWNEDTGDWHMVNRERIEFLS